MDGGGEICNAAVLTNALSQTSCLDEWVVEFVFSPSACSPGIFSLRLPFSGCRASSMRKPNGNIWPWDWPQALMPCILFVSLSFLLFFFCRDTPQVLPSIVWL